MRRLTGVHGVLWCGHLRENEHLESLGDDSKIILKCMSGHEVEWERKAGCCECGNEYSVYIKCGDLLDSLRTCWLLQMHCAAVHCINRTVQTVRRQKSVPCRTDRSSPSVTGSPALFLQSTFRSPVRSVTLHQTDDAVSVTFLQTSTFFSTRKPCSLLRRPFTTRASGRLPVASFMNRGAPTTVPTVFSEHSSISNHISAFVCYVYMFVSCQ